MILGGESSTLSAMVGEGGGPSSTELFLLKRRKVALLRQRAALVKGFGLLNYKPHTKQDRFHRAGAYYERLWMAGNRAGKSHGGCNEDSSWLYGERVFYPKTDPARYVGIPKRPVKGLVITTDWDKVDEIWTTEVGDPPGKLWRALPADFVKSKSRNQAGVINEVGCANGSLLRFASVKAWLNNPQSMESSDWDFIHIDEPCPIEMFNAAARGLVDRGGKVWFTLTPLKEQWIVDRFFPKDCDRKKLPDEYVQKHQWVQRSTMHDNPYLDPDAIERYLSTLSTEERSCREQGLPLELAGLIYKEFDYDRHVLKDVPKGWVGYNNPPPEYAIYIQIDPHPQTPHCVLFWAIDPLGHKFLFDEIFLHCKIDDLCTMIHSKSANRNVIRIICDPTVYVNHPVTGENMEAEFARCGVFVEKASKALTQGIMRTQQELAKPDNIYIAPNLSNFLYEIQRYSWNEDKGKPVDKDDHAMECMYRFLIEDPIYVPPVDRADIAPVGELVIDRAHMRLEDLDDVYDL